MSTPDLSNVLFPAGSRIGPWRVASCAGRGAFGAVYRVYRVEREDLPPFALKLAHSPKEPRFEREVELLRRIHHAQVPRVHEVGWWKHANGVLFPYFVMDWVEGQPLYEWAARGVSSRQVLRVMGQVARALEATHGAGAVHRDVKGANVLVSAADTAVLVDFGAGTFEGAAPLTWQALPPGTPQYRSPQALRFYAKWRPHRDAPYTAGPADDLYALGVTAYRLVTGIYPPPHVQVEVGAVEGEEHDNEPKWVPPEELATVSPELAQLIRQLLSVEPSARGSARQVAEAAERAVRNAGQGADELITPHVARAAPGHRQWVRALRPVLGRAAWLAASAVAGMVLTLWVKPRVAEEKSLARQEAAQAGAMDRSEVGLADEQEIGQVGEARLDVVRAGVTLEMPKEPLPGQLRGPCKTEYEDEIRGGCWVALRKKPPCGKDSYEWKDACYWPSFPAKRPDTSGKQ
jgi:hypothetical protein